MKDERVMDGTKLMWHHDRIIAHYEKGEVIAPVHIDMGLTKFCNIGCIFCFGDFQNKSKDYIKEEALLSMLKEAGKEGVRSIGFIGDGEPTCNPAVYKALATGRNAGIDMAMSTNGVLLNTPERRKAVLENTVWMRFCLAAGDREGYQRIHRADKFDIVKNNIEALLDEREKMSHRADVGLQAVYVPEIMDEDMLKESALAVQLGVDYFVIKQCSLPDGNRKVGVVEFEPSAYEGSKRVLAECEAMSTPKTKIIPKWGAIMRKGAREYEHCPAVPLISEMSGNGDWFPCGYFFGNKPQYAQYRFGNIHEKGFSEILHSDRYRRITEHFKTEFDSHSECFGHCRLDMCNKYIDAYLKKPKGVNFV